MDKKIYSPDKLHKIDFIYESEIRFGPPYFRIKIDDYLLENRIWGDSFNWSTNSRFLALQEWLTTEYAKGPITRLVLIDILGNRFSNFRKADNGFTENYSFNDNIILYEKHYKAKGNIIECEVNIEKIKNWEQLVPPKSLPIK